MKLPKIPKLRLPFLKGRKDEAANPEGTGDEALDEISDDGTEEGVESQAPDIEPAAPEPSPSPKPGRWARIKRVLGLLGISLLALLVIGGTGGLFGWLYMNAEHTTARRDLLRPQLTVDILSEDEMPRPNSSASASVPSDDNTAGGQSQAGNADGTQSAAADEKLDALAGGVLLNPIDPQLHEERDELILPIVGLDGRKVWTDYARPFDFDDRRPRLAIVIMNLGLDDSVTDMVLEMLPGQVTLSYSPYASDLAEKLERARADGHEVMIDLPMEPLAFPRDDPGPHTLLTSLSTVENLNRLEWVLGQAPGYVGVTTWMGSQFTTVEDAMMPVLESLKERGVLFLDSRDSSRSLASELASSIQVPRAFNNRFIDNPPSRGAIDRSMQDLELSAKQNDFAIGLARPLPITINRLAAWVPALEARGIAVAPVSAIADRQSIR